MDRQGTGRRDEPDRARASELLKKDVGARQGRVSAERDFHGRREPPEPSQSVGVGFVDEGGLREIHLPRDGRHGLLGEPVDVQTDGRGIPLERGVRERVHRIEWNPFATHRGYHFFGEVWDGPGTNRVPLFTSECWCEWGVSVGRVQKWVGVWGGSGEIG